VLKKNWWVLVLFSLSLIFFVAQNVNQRFWLNDFQVYYEAGRHLLAGQNLYGVFPEDSRPHFVYKYSPLAAALFVPLSFLPFSLAKILGYWILVLLLLWFLNRAYSLFAPDSPARKNWILLATFLILSPHFQRELHLGQVNLVMLALLLLALRTYLNRKSFRTAGLWSICFFLKPQVLLFLPYFLVKRNFRILAYILPLVLIGFLVPIIFYGWQMNLNQHQLWLKELSLQMQGGNLSLAKHNLAGFVSFWLGLKPYLASHPAVGKFFGLGLTLLVGMLFLVFIQKRVNNFDPALADFAVLLFLMPLLSVTDSQPFLFGTLAVVLILYHWGKGGISPGEKVFLIVAFLLVGGNWHDLWGERLFLKWEEVGLLGIGSIMILGYIYVLRMKRTY